MRKLLNWRRSAPAMRDGKLTQYVPQDGVYVYFRHNDAQKVMVVLNNSDDSRTLDMHALPRIHRRPRRHGCDHAAATRLRAKVPARSAMVLEVT